MFFQGANVDHKQLSGSKPNLWFESRKTEIPQPVQLAQAVEAMSWRWASGLMLLEISTTA